MCSFFTHNHPLKSPLLRIRKPVRFRVRSIVMLDIISVLVTVFLVNPGLGYARLARVPSFSQFQSSNPLPFSSLPPPPPIPPLARAQYAQRNQRGARGICALRLRGSRDTATLEKKSFLIIPTYMEATHPRNHKGIALNIDQLRAYVLKVTLLH